MRPVNPETGGGGVLALNAFRLFLNSSASALALSITDSNGFTSAGSPALGAASFTGTSAEVPADAVGSSAGGDGDGCCDDVPTGSSRGISPLPRVRAREGDAALLAFETNAPEVTVELNAG